MKTSSKSGVGSDQVLKAQKCLDDYKFLQWYDSYIRQKLTETNVMAGSSNSISVDPRSQLEPDCSEKRSLSAENASSSEVSPEVSIMSGTESRVQSANNQDEKKKVREKRRTQDEVMNEVAAFLKFKRSKATRNSDSAEDVFGKWIAEELKLFPDQMQVEIKHEISDLIYRYRRISSTASQEQPQSSGSSGLSFNMPSSLIKSHRNKHFITCDCDFFLLKNKTGVRKLMRHLRCHTCQS